MKLMNAGVRRRSTALAMAVLMAMASYLATAGLAEKKPLQIELEPVGTYRVPGDFFEEGVAEVVAHDPRTQRIFLTNDHTNSIDVVSFSDPGNIQLLFSMDLSFWGAAPTSVTVHQGIVAVSVVASPNTDPGKAVFFDTDGNFLSSVTVGALPDMITFTPDGRFVLTANEGEPSEDYTVDPEGSVSVISMAGGARHVTQQDVRTADFTAFNDAALDPSIRIYGPNASVAQDLEPEFIAVSHDSRTAWVTLQEANAIGILNVEEAKVERLVGLGFKNHNLPANGLDASDRDNAINIRNWPVFGIYEPDAITAFRVLGRTYLATANEGDTRATDGFNEESRVSALTLDPTAFPDGATLRMNANLGRLTVTNVNGDTDRDGDYDELYVPGARSFTIWDENGAKVWDSGDQLEQITAFALPAQFNSNNDDNDSFDTRSDNKGPEPESVAVGMFRDRILLFVGLERIGGIVVFDVSDPEHPEFLTYFNNRNFAGDPSDGTAGDLAPETIQFISVADSPIHEPLIIVGNEISGSVTAFRIKDF